MRRYRQSIAITPFIIAAIFIALIFSAFLMSGCEDIDNSTHLGSTDPNGEQLHFMAEFYDNYGNGWLCVKGSEFNIQPNKVKEYYYDSDGVWTWKWDISSVMSVVIDGQDIETCGSTVLFYDTGLTKINMELPEDIELGQDNVDSTITVPDALRWKDYLFIDWWWRTSRQNNQEADARIVVIQSQNGDPICMFAGDEVYWRVSENLPKTTEIIIDGKMLYIHRANFAIIDTAVFE